ncbi:anaerobic cobalt chelatase [Methanolacinia petrolearia DSM 11571]|uniref:Anaerobic cobalt chelatase n=1 Tax=Methanolacinia petrolearia (strain DSM 11571 / OCM 486 / SEBR 4847) TaxID=679926 RepID=E1RKP8_METP4|nr:sirohydrochlorin cobaltochelatase [Methanolacinia petrolearia]ADN36987.1 anaerobic cobalt chelatase [Methanolacinia petrolearia DSM 11571]
MKGHGNKPESHGAVLVVAMGTTQEEGRAVVDRCIELVKKTYPKADVEFAFNYEAVRLVLKENGEEVLSPLAAMTRLLDKGHSQVVVQPLYLTPGMGYHELYRIIVALNDLAGAHGAIGFDGILISRPLLMNTEDYFEVAEIIDGIYAGSLAEDEALVLVTPTSEGGADTSLCQMQMVMDDICKSGKIVIGAVGGYPGVERAVKRLGHVGAKKVRLVPFSLVPGIHAWIETSGESNPDSWKKALESEGYQVTVDEKALGEHEEIISVFAGRLKDAVGSHGFLK